MLPLLQLACGIHANEEAPTLETPTLEREQGVSNSEMWGYPTSEMWCAPRCGHNAEKNCNETKDNFRTSITERTGLAMPYWHRLNGPSLSSPDALVTTGVIVMHGAGLNGGPYMCAMDEGVRKRLVTDEAVGQVLLVAPQVYIPEAFPLAENAHSHAPNELSWKPDTTAVFTGGNSSGDVASLSLFSVLDEMVEAMMDKDSYPKLTRVVLIGHSAGGICIQRYALASALEPRDGVTISYFAGNPGSVAYLTPVRPNLIDRGSLCDAKKLLSQSWSFSVPVHIDGCDNKRFDVENNGVYDEWPDGLMTGEDTWPYIAARPAAEMRLAYLARNVTLLSGSRDVCPCIESLDGTNCSSTASVLFKDGVLHQCGLLGFCHMEVSHAFAQHVELVYNQMASGGTCEFCKHRPPSHRLVLLPGVTHDADAVFAADESLAAIFPDALSK